MKVLFSAIACDPERGSEAHFGWTALRAIARDHDVWLIGHSNDRANLLKARDRGELPATVRLHFHEGCRARSRHRILARLQNWQEYAVWIQQSLSVARRLDAEVDFDVVHHVTLASWRVASPLWQLGKPFVWGPLGGGEEFPLRLLGILSPASRLYELFRRFQGFLASSSPGIRSAVREASVLLAANGETAGKLQRLGAKGRVKHLCPAFFGAEEIRVFSQVCEERPESVASGPLRAFAGGDIEGRKGIGLALEAVAHAIREEGLEIYYCVAGQGPEAEYLTRRAAELGVSQNFDVLPLLDRAAYLEALSRSDVYLLPSLRDSAGITLMEAMLAGVVPLVTDCGGPGGIVAEGLGWKIPLSDRAGMVRKLIEILKAAASDRVVLRRKGDEASRHIQEHYSEETYRREISSAYKEACRPLHTLG